MPVGAGVGGLRRDSIAADLPVSFQSPTTGTKSELGSFACICVFGFLYVGFNRERALAEPTQVGGRHRWCVSCKNVIPVIEIPVNQRDLPHANNSGLPRPCQRILCIVSKAIRLLTDTTSLDARSTRSAEER
jgi:hypothetical protein